MKKLLTVITLFAFVACSEQQETPPVPITPNYDAAPIHDSTPLGPQGPEPINDTTLNQSDSVIDNHVTEE